MQTEKRVQTSTRARHLPRTILTVVATITLTCGHDSRAGDTVVFSRDIRPVLAAKCYACHGPDERQRSAGLRLDQRAFALAKLPSGAAAVVPGKPQESELIRRIHAITPDERMPPVATKKSLTAEEKELLRQWIRDGAPYEAHWSFQRPRRHPVPPVEGEGWVRNEIDHFILERLEREKMSPSAEADRMTLIRRLSFDLRGLPPHPAEIDRFVADRSPRAYENLVDRMLASPHYGERMCQDWLDLARYGDTNGYHSDSSRDMWLYRDYVIDAFNSNKPYDRFIVENLAGDLLPESTVDTNIASGFNRCTTFNEEGGADPAEFSVAYAVDRANTTGQVFLGLTFGCAQCHDHKYDPISQREYYQFYAFFNSVLDEIGAGGKTGHHGKPLPPLLSTPSEEQKGELQQLDHELRSVEKQIGAELSRRDLAEERDDFEASFAAWASRIARESGPEEVPRNGLRVWLDASDLDGNGHDDQNDGTFGPSVVNTWRDRSDSSLVFEAHGDPELVQDGLAGRPVVRFDGEGDFLAHPHAGGGLGEDFTAVWVHRHSRVWSEQTYVQWGLEARAQSRLFVKHITSHQPQFGRRGGPVAVPRRQKAGEPYVTAFRRNGKTNVVRFEVDGARRGEKERKGQTPFEGNTALHVGANFEGTKALCGDVAEVLLYDRELTDKELAAVGRYLTDKYALESKYREASPGAVAAARTPNAQRDGQQSAALRNEFVRDRYAASREVFAPLTARVREVATAREKIEASFPTTMVMVEKTQRNAAYVLMRGDFQKPGEQVDPDVPRIFPPLPEGVPRNRLGLAHWLTRSDHPLVARVVVNRLWKLLFGTGLVKTMGDFGTQGEWPSHPELLDWLAVEFLESGWDVKRLQRRMLLSATYRQSSAQHHLYDDVDPYNRLLSRASRFRLAAEEVRDAALFVGGLLDRRLGGPSVKPHQPADYYSDKVGGSWKESEGSDLYRRGLYTFWRRTTLYPAFQIFDAPSREICTVDRPRTNTPLQALTTLNDLPYIEAARVFAQRILRDAGPSTLERVMHGFRIAVGRTPKDSEKDVLMAVAHEQQQVYSRNAELAKTLASTGRYPVAPVPVAELAAWTAFCNVLLNLDEFFTRE